MVSCQEFDLTIFSHDKIPNAFYRMHDNELSSFQHLYQQYSAFALCVSHLFQLGTEHVLRKQNGGCDLCFKKEKYKKYIRLHYIV